MICAVCNPFEQPNFLINKKNKKVVYIDMRTCNAIAKKVKFEIMFSKLIMKFFIPLTELLVCVFKNNFDPDNII